MVSMKTLIDGASKRCGSQNALAEFVGISSGKMSLARSGKRPLSAAHLQTLADLIEYDPALLWEFQEIANMPRRNPFASKIKSGVSSVLKPVYVWLMCDADTSAETRLIGSTELSPKGPLHSPPARLPATQTGLFPDQS